jgi:dTDP-4-dehydrorhamnose reductase
MKILVLGANGMLGNAVLRVFASSDGFDAYGTVRRQLPATWLSDCPQAKLISGVDMLDADQVMGVFGRLRPHAIINCVGLVKQLGSSEDPLAAIPINALQPHRAARLAALIGARFIHVSTDCVFSGKRGNYTESDQPDASDLYGRTKLLGEVDYPNAITLRTSIIGHELSSSHSLVGWFLAQTGLTKGYRRAIFSGLPTVEVAHVIRDFVIPAGEMRGVYHLSADPISKLDLLKLIATTYGKEIEIVPNDEVIIDRSLNSSRFREKTGYSPRPWPQLIAAMENFR